MILIDIYGKIDPIIISKKLGLGISIRHKIWLMVYKKILKKSI